MTDLFAPIDIYCERTDASFLSEPLNFCSNIAFVIAGILILRNIRRTHFKSKQPGSTFLAWLVIVIGIGSGLFHSNANGWSQWADVLPIAIYVFTYLVLFLRFTAGAPPLKTALIVAGFVVLSTLVAGVSDHQLSNGSEAYFGTWIALFGISCFYAGRKQALNQWRMALAALTFTLSLFMRTVDLLYCEAWPSGTHVFWHILNSIVIYLITVAYASERSRT